MTDPLPSWTAHLPDWIPQSLSDLHGPQEGTVDLPLDLCWSGYTRYDVSSFHQRVVLYHLVIAQGLRKHYPEFLHADHLVEAWPLLRRRMGPGYIDAWERRFTELAEIGADVGADQAAVAKWRATTW